MEQKTRKRKSKLLLLLIICVLIGGIGGITAYVNSGYVPLEWAKTALESDEKVTIEEKEGAVVFIPEKPKEALIFYPGGLVDHKAYAPLMRSYAEEGMLCILLEMPLDLAVLDMNAAEDYRELFSEISDWYVGGHSLGGAMAASYLEEHTAEYKGLILCAAYSTVDYSESDLEVISMYGSKDLVLNAEKYEECRENLPSEYKELIIEGGNHAFFGNYGQQEGDGEAEITNESQIEAAVEFTLKNIR